jgi:hypothetical protein
MDIVGAVGFFVLITAIVVSLIWRKAFLKQAELKYRNGDEYRELAAKAEEGQARLAEQLAAVNERLARIEAGNASIEQTLKVVD